MKRISVAGSTVALTHFVTVGSWKHRGGGKYTQCFGYDGKHYYRTNAKSNWVKCVLKRHIDAARKVLEKSALYDALFGKSGR